MGVREEAELKVTTAPEPVEEEPEAEPQPTTADNVHPFTTRKRFLLPSTTDQDREAA